MANPIAVPGTNVPSGAAVSPGGAQGVTGTAGAPAWTTCTSAFTIPAVGSSVSVPVVDTSWITIGEMLYVDQAGGGVGLSGILQVTAKTSTSLTLLNPTPAPAIPPADATQAGLLKQLSGNTTDFVDGTNTCQNLPTAVQPTIWSARLRSFNAVGNPTFEVDQRNVGNLLNNPAAGTGLLDRWFNNMGGTMTVKYLKQAASVKLPGTNFAITQNQFNINLATQQTTLGANDLLYVNQVIEGPQFRELSQDVHSISVLAYSAVAPLKFAVFISDNPATKTLVKLCTIPTANTWTLIQLPNIPVWPSANFTTVPGAAGYTLGVCVAAGSNWRAPVADTWQNGQFFGAPGMDNWAANAVGTNFYLGFVQHEPGPLCTTLIDKPFSQNYDECLRYYQKTYSYGTKAGSASILGGLRAMIVPSANLASAYGPIAFHKPMAKAPTVTTYAYDGTVNAALMVGGSNVTVSAVNNVGETGFNSIAFSANQAASGHAQLQYTADTGW